VLHEQPRANATRVGALPLWRRSVTLRVGFFAGETSSLLRPSPSFAGCQRIERCPTDLESVRPPWPAPCSASCGN